MEDDTVLPSSNTPTEVSNVTPATCLVFKANVSRVSTPGNNLTDGRLNPTLVDD